MHSRLSVVRSGGFLIWLPVLLAASFPFGLVLAVSNLLFGANRAALIQGTEFPVDQDIEFSFTLPAGFTPEVQRWAPNILRWSVEHDLPAELVATVMQIESCGHPAVHSGAGAAGLFQVMPFHFGAGEDPLEPETNAFRGLSYLARGLDLAQGNARLALAGYNGGHGQITRAPSEWPAETQRYVRWGSEILEDVRAGRFPSPGVQAWLQAGGAGLCMRAAGILARAPEWGIRAPEWGTRAPN